MTNVYDNAGHLERLGALARENEDLKRRLEELEKQQPVRLTDEQVAKVDTAICEALGEAYDYLRGGIAWSCETMGPEDFSLVADDSDRVASIREAVLQALGLVEGAEPLKAEPVRLTDEQIAEAYWKAMNQHLRPQDKHAVLKVVRAGEEAVLRANGRIEGADNG